MAPPEAIRRGFSFSVGSEAEMKAQFWRAAACFGLAACQPESMEEPQQVVEEEAATPSGAAVPPIQPAPAIEAVDSLAGEWRVAGIDGIPLDEPYGIALSASGHEIWWRPRCAGVVRGYAIDGLRFAAGPARSAASPPVQGVPAPVVCAIGPPPRLTDVSRALDAATRIERTPQNGVLLSGGEHSLLLFSQ